MRIVYSYNEILPKKKAHDVFIFQECAALADAGLDLTLLCGKGSLGDEDLFQHYGTPLSKRLQIKRLPILRKNNPLHLSWNFPFFFSCQRYLEKQKPDWVFLSVRKQAAYHLKRKCKHVRYLYEVHELMYYPGETSSALQEKEMLVNADLITVTTQALKEILRRPPYSLTVPIFVVPLAVKQQPLPPPPQESNPLVLMYIGQLYLGQGLPTLLRACQKVPNVHLQVVGGKNEEIASLKRLAETLGLESRIEWLGFQPPSHLSEIAKSAHAFVAPFDEKERMPYVAHTKLYEYATWGRPFIAPDLPCVREHFSEKEGVLLFQAENVESLAGCIAMLQDDGRREEMQRRICAFAGRFTWDVRAASYLELLANL